MHLDAAPDSIFQLGNAYYLKGMFAESLEEYLKGFARMGYPPDNVTELRKAFGRSGFKGFWQKLIEQLTAVPPTEQDTIQIAAIYAALGDKDQTIEWLEKAYAEHSAGMVRLKDRGFAFLDQILVM